MIGADTPTLGDFHSAVRVIRNAVSDAMHQHDMDNALAVAALGALLGAWLRQIEDTSARRERVDRFVTALRNSAGLRSAA
jgi:hypothetical protein